MILFDEIRDLIFKKSLKKVNNSVYNSQNILNYIKSDEFEVIEISDNLKFDNQVLITIQTNCYEVSNDKIQDNIDIFSTIYKNDKAIEFVFYNNKKSNFIELNDDLCYGQYLEGMEFTEGNLAIYFDKIIDKEINKIKVGLAIFENERNDSIDLSIKHIKDFVITIIYNKIIYYKIQNNGINGVSKFCNFITFVKINDEWILLNGNEEHKSVNEFYKMNFIDNKTQL